MDDIKGEIIFGGDNIPQITVYTNSKSNVFINLDQAMADPATIWGSADKKSYKVITAKNKTLGITVRFAYPSGLSGLGALRMVEKAESKKGEYLLPSLMSAFLAADMGIWIGKKEINYSPWLFGLIAQRFVVSEASQLSKDEINRHVDLFITALANGEEMTYPTGALDIGRLLLFVGKKLWEEDTHSMLACAEMEFTSRWVASNLAAGWIGLLKRQDMKIRGVNVHILPASLYLAWPQIAAWHSDHMNNIMVELIVGGNRLFPYDENLSPMMYPFSAGKEMEESAFESAALASMNKKMFDEALENKNGGMVGRLAVEMPDSLSIVNALGLTTATFYLGGHTAWVMLSGNGERGPSFYWDPDQGEESSSMIWAIPRQLRPQISLVLNALWRDLVVSGEKAFTHLRGMGATEVDGAWVFEGRYSWGGGADIEAIEAIGNYGKKHLKKLSSGQSRAPDAAVAARLYGIDPLPLGTTFVRPPKPPKLNMNEINARGLANLIILQVVD